MNIFNKILICALTALASLYLTFQVGTITLTTSLQYIFVFCYFVCMCLLAMFLKKRLIKKPAVSRRMYICVLSAAFLVLIVFQNVFLPTRMKTSITLQAIENEEVMEFREVWLTDALMDGEKISLSQLSLHENVNWEYNEDYDDYVYIPNPDHENNYCTFTVYAHKVALTFAQNEWSGSVKVTVPNLGEQIVSLNTKDPNKTTYVLDFDTGRNYSIFERVIYNSGLLCILNFCMVCIVQVYIQTYKKRIGSSNKKNTYKNIMIYAIFTFAACYGVWRCSYLGTGYILLYLGIGAFIYVTSLYMWKKHLISFWNNKSLHWKCSIVVLSLFLSVAFQYKTGAFLPSRSYPQSDITVIATGEKNESSNSNEVWILEIRMNDNAIDLSTIPLSDGWLLRGSSLCALPDSINQPVTLSLHFESSAKIEIDLYTHSWSGRAQIICNDKRIDYDLYKHEDGIVSYVLRNRPYVNTWPVWIGAFILTAIIILTILMVTLWIGQKNKIIYGICYEVLTGVLYFSSEYINPSASTALILGILSLAISLLMCYAWQSKSMIKYKSSCGLIVGIIAISLYASFASFGYRLFLSGQRITFSFGRTSYWLIGAIWFFPIIFDLLYVLEYISTYLKPECQSIEKSTGSIKHWAILTVIILSCQCIGFVGFFPGCFPSDSIDQIQQALGIYMLNDWHPVLHTLIMRLILWIFKTPAALVCFQMLCFSGLLSSVLMVGYESGLRFTWVCVIAIVFSLLPNQIMSAMCVVKDLPYTFSLVWGTLLLLKLTKQIEILKRPTYIMKLALCLFLICSFRHNGIIPFLIILAFLIAVTIRYWKRIKAYGLACIGIACLLVGGFKGPVFKALNVAPNAVTPYVTMFCAVGSCINKGGTFSDETTKKLEQVMPLEDWATYYSRFSGHDPYMFDRGEGKTMDLTQFSMAEAFQIYLEALIKYPDIVIKDRLDGTNILWDVSQPDEAFNARYFDFVYISQQTGMLFNENAQPGSTYYNRSPIATLYRKLSVPFQTDNEQIDSVWDMLIWRSGAYLILFGVLVIYWIKNRMCKIIPVTLLFIGNTLGMMLVLYHQSFRYVYYVQILVLMLMVATFDLQTHDLSEANKINGGMDKE